ncbi:MAG: sugar ABC transporter permease [Lachnospiraceae bacterium]|jgi:multiple sugar transport system permease protein|nr:sugar ABC transporter permease [Lachnospiraceae bacterium]
MANRTKRDRIGWLFVLPSLAGVMIFYLVPFVDVVRRSFRQAVGGGFAGLENYRQVLLNKAFILAIGNTVRFVSICLPLLLLLSLGVALLLQNQKRYREVMKSAYLVPLAIPATSVVLLWQLLFDNNGFLNGIVSLFHIESRDWMNDGTAFGVLVFSYIWKNLGYDVVLWLSGLLGIPVSIYEAAKVDGAGPINTFFYITIPNIKPVAFTIVILSFLNSFKVFREAYLVAGNYPHESIYLLQHVFNNWFSELSIDKMAAGSVLLCTVVALLVLLLQRSWDKSGV